jgi:GNAT superfamily N-acetyltransferase
MAALTKTDPTGSIVPLELRDVSQLRIGWRSRLAADDIRRVLNQLPGRSMWDRQTYEYGIVAPWRNRTDVVQIAELSAVLHPEEMVIAISERARELGASLTVMVEVDESRRSSFYDRCGFTHIEKVITFEIERRDAPRVVRPRELTFVPVDPANNEMRQTLLRLDNRSFPWIWWNSDLEFRLYGKTPGVEIYLGLIEGQPVSYVGITTFPTWGHLDRIAVDPGLQGKGYGRFTLAFAVETLLARGARKVGLSTQSTNERSQRLYLKYGFRRTNDHDYDLWGDDFRMKGGITIPSPAT